MNALAKAVRMARIYGAYRLRREVLPYGPLRLWIETASACNLRCVMCPNKDVAADAKGLMRLDLFDRVIGQARRFAHDVYLHHRGEPLLNPALFDMIRIARGAGLKVRFHTNGTLLDEARAERLLDVGPNLVSFSFDGFSKAAYEQIRVGATFERTRDRILHLAERRRARGLKRPYLVVEKIRFKRPSAEGTPAEVEALRRQFLAAGVDEIIEKDEYVWAEPNAADPGGERPCAVCTFPWYAMVVCADGTVTACPQDFHAVLRMGQAAETPLAEIWNGPAYRRLRRDLARDLECLALCRTCDRLRRRTVGGVPLQYMATFLVDQWLGYGRFRKWLGTHERT